MTGYNSQTAKGEYKLQFETDDYDKFRYVEEAARRCVDNRHIEVCSPVIHAHWIRHERAEEVEGRLIPNYECSHCHEWFRDNRRRCGECGAKMDEEVKQ